MNWVNELYDLYEKNKECAGIMTEKLYRTKDGTGKKRYCLLPVAHTTASAQITVTINEAGEFIKAEKVEEVDKLTIIPATEKSASRAGAVAEPHPFCDSLKYVAGDYMSYYGGKDGKNFSKNFPVYIEALKKWKDSAYTHDKVNALYAYLSKEKLVEDLVNDGVLKTDADGKILDGEKIQTILQADAFVRFCIETPGGWDKESLSDKTGKFHTECWKDISLHQSFIVYSESLLMEKSLSYLSGRTERIAHLHSSKIRNEGDRAKLISTNDGSNFTFRGRFTDEDKAIAIGYEDSQKVHNALKWIIRRQGSYLDSMTIVVWESDLKPVPDFKADSDELGRIPDMEGWEAELEQEEIYAGTGEATADRLRKAFHGYKENLSKMSKTVLLSFDAATTGRLAMTEYKNFESARYIENIGYWHKSCRWIYKKFRDNKPYYYEGMTGIEEIAKALYGTEQSGRMALGEKSKKMYAEVCKRLLPCITERKQIPVDMVNLAVQKASNPLAYEESYNWEQILAIACSFVKKQVLEREKEEWSVALNKESKERNYLYGRLLAIADGIEYLAYIKEGVRETNAKRYMSAFSQRPFQTWPIIEGKMQPYIQKLNPGTRLFYQNLLDEVYQAFEEGDFQDNSRLNGLYLLGYHCQSYELKNKKEEENKEE